MSENDVNNEFMLKYVQSLPHWETLRVLDYGCGAGELVRLLREHGVEAYGTEIMGSYATRGESNVDIAELGWYREFEPGQALPWAPGSFDLILSKMVFEHIPEPEVAFEAMRRVLAPGGRMYHQFPTAGVVRENHIGIPFAHWWRRGSRTRGLYVHTLACLGLGTRKGYRASMTPLEWTAHSLGYLDAYTHYKRFNSYKRIFGEYFDLRFNEIDYCRFRARERPALSAMLRIEPLAPVYTTLFRRLAFWGMELQPRD